ncbi:copper resistance CopC/CopD family protein [Rathayibacter sp. CAU 1779]
MSVRVRLVAVVGAVLALVLVAWPVGAAPASAHATVVGTAPQNGAEVKESPTSIRVTFDESVTMPPQGDTAAVVDAAGRRVDAGAQVLEKNRTVLVIPLRNSLPKGTYIASWSVVSADSHPVGGSLQFGVRTPAIAAAAPAVHQPSAGLALTAGVVKGAVYLGFVVGLGLLPAASLFGARRRVAGLARAGLAFAIVASLAQLVVQYLWDTSGGATGAVGAGGGAGAGRAAGIGGLAGGEQLWAGLIPFLGSSYAVAVGVRLLGLALAVAVLPGTRVFGRPLALQTAIFAAAGVVAIGALVVDGHGASSWLQFVSTALHATAAIAWLGGLVMLGWLLLRRRLTAARLQRLPAWSLYAGACVLVLVISGVLQSVIQVRYPAALLTTTYGILLLAKLVLVGVVLVLAARNRAWVRRTVRESVGVAASTAVATFGSGIRRTVPSAVAENGSETQSAAAQTPSGISAVVAEGAVATLAAEPVREDHGRPAPGQTAALRRRVRWEAAIGGVVVIVSGVLSSITPAEAAYAPVVAQQRTIGPYTVTFDGGPARRGQQSFRVTVVGADDSTPLPQRVELQLSEASGPVKALPVSFPFRVAGVNHPGTATPIDFASATVTLPRSGSWVATLTVVADAFDQYTAELDYPVQ